MYSQLGDVIFEKLKGFNTLTREHSARLAEHQLIDGKSILQKMGDELESLSVEIYVHKSFADPQEMSDTLKGYKTDGAILPFVDGDGLFLGNFVLVSISEAVSQLTPTGGLLALTLSLTLREYYDPDPEFTKAQNALKSAFAIEENGVVPVRNTALTPTPIGVVTSNVTSAKSASVAAVANVQLATVSPSQSDSLLNRAKLKLDQVQNSASTAISKLQDVNSLAQSAPDLLSSLETVKANAALMKTYCENGDISNALTQGQSLTDAVGVMDDAVLPLTLNSIMRKP